MTLSIQGTAFSYLDAFLSERKALKATISLLKNDIQVGTQYSGMAPTHI